MGTDAGLTVTDAVAEAATPPAPPPTSLTRTAWGGILLLALIVLCGATTRTLFAPIQEVAKISLGLSDFQISLVQGIAAAVPVAIISLPLGWLADRATRTRILIGLAIAWTVGTIATAFAPNFEMLFLARMLAGVGGTCVVPVAISVAADMSLPASRGRSLLFLSMGNVFGGAAAFVAGGALFTLFSGQVDLPFVQLEAWREVCLLLGVLSAVLILPLLALAEPARQEVEQVNASFRAMTSALWRRRGFLAPLFVGQITVTMADVAATIWAAPVLSRDFAQSPGQAAALIGGVLIIAGVVGSIMGGVVADWGHKRNLRGGVLIGAVVAAAIGVPAGLFPIMTDTTMFGLVLLILMISGTVCGLVTATAIAVLVPNEERGTCLGAFMILGTLIGMGASPILVSLGSQMLGGEAKLALSLAIVGVGVGVVSLAGFVIAMLNAPKPVPDATAD